MPVITPPASGDADRPPRLPRRLDTSLRYLRYDPRLRRIVLWGTGGLVALGVAWLVVTGLLVRQHVRQLEAGLQQVQTRFAAGDLAGARQAAARIPGEAHQAQLLTSGPAWWLAAHVPYLGRPVQTVRGAVDATAQLGRSGIPRLLDVATLMDPARLRVRGDTLDLSALRAAEPELRHASATLAATARQVEALPHHTWLGAVDRPWGGLADELRSLTGYVDAAVRAARILPAMLGATTPQRYFIGMQNEAELRGTGGLPGAFAIAVASHGTVRFTHFGSDAELEPVATGHLIETGISFGRGYAAAYGFSLPSASFLNSNVSPNFPYAARIWAAMWERVSGQHVDGAIAVDPTVLGYILAATGPVTLPDGITVTAQNVVALTQRDEYAMFDDNAERKAFLVAVLKAVSNALISGKGDPLQLADYLVAVSEQQRLQVWSSDAAVEAQLAQTSYGAVMTPTDRPLIGPVLNNTSGGKLDFYLTRGLTYHRSGCGAERDVLVTLTLTNNAPAYGLPPYVTDRLDRAPGDSAPGDYSTLLDYYATKGAQLLSVQLDGRPVAASRLTVDGQPMFRMPVQLPRGQTQTITLHLAEPPGSGPPLVWRQPGVTPMTVTAYSQSCG